MTRQIEFRARCIECGIFVYGYYDYNGNDDTHFITEEAPPLGGIRKTHIVGGKTVGQWTRLFDKNGVKIFEGDIVQLKNKEGEKDANHMEGIGTVIWDERKTGWLPDNMMFGWGGTESIEVLGNIHANPEFSLP